MIKKLIAIFLFSNCSLLYAQTIKTDVLVIGGSAGGVAAAIQSAGSKVKTILAEEDTIPALFEKEAGHADAGVVAQGEMSVIKEDRNLASCLWGEFRKRLKESRKGEKGLDTTDNSPLTVDSWSCSEILKKMTDTVKKLAVYKNIIVTAIKKDNDFWDVSVTQNGKTKLIKTRVVIDATPGGRIARLTGASYPRLDSLLNEAGSKLYRTSIAMGDGIAGESHHDITAGKENYPPSPSYCIPMKAVIAKGVDNLLSTEILFPANNNLLYLPRQLILGQGVGTIAAYCAFFKTTTNNLKVRIIQGELLDFKGHLLPFTDIPQNDADWRAIQQVCATGLLKGVQQVSSDKAQFLFNPDLPVSTSEVQPVLTEIYTRAFLWFGKEKPGDKFTVGNLLSFISDYTLTDPSTLKVRMQKDWKTRYKFKHDFDLNRQVSRREFAVLANSFLNPFARIVDLNGRLVN
ncbi:MAG: FAD-dependent oxidoreductase [Sphingobacteriales bacterium]